MRSERVSASSQFLHRHRAATLGSGLYHEARGFVPFSQCKDRAQSYPGGCCPLQATFTSSLTLEISSLIPGPFPIHCDQSPSMGASGDPMVSIRVQPQMNALFNLICQ